MQISCNLSNSGEAIARINEPQNIADPITTSVLMQLRPAELKEVAQVTAGTPIERILSKYFEVAMADSRCAFHLSEFIDASLLHYELRLPRCLTEYAAGRLPSASPNRATWTRMTRGHTAEIENESADSDENHSEIDDEDEPSATLDEGPGDWVSRLRLLLGSRRKKLTPSRALSELQRHLANSQSGMQEKLFLDFAVDMLRAHHRDKLRSIRSLVLGVATRLPVALDLNNPGSIAPDRLSNAYSFLLDDATSPSQYNKLRRYLREFHHWLERTKQCEGIDEPDIFGSAKQAQAVDARLILEDEYVAVRDSLVDSSTSFDESLSGDKELRLIAGLVLILGFRGGLRRDEALKAQLDAALLDSPAEFLVRPWSERKLKTPNAVRKLPLEALLDPYELALLRAWVQRRQGQNSRSAPSPFLFFASQLPEHLCVPEGRIFPVIHEELRRVTGDERCHFHTARKSGAGTFLAFTLLRPPGVPLPGWLDQWPKQRLRLENAAEIHRKLYRNDFATRRHLFAVAKTLGHSSPGVSCANYLELQGDLLALWLDTERPFLSTNQFRMLTEKSVGTAHGSKQDLYQGVWAQIERKFSSLNLTCIGRKQQG